MNDIALRVYRIAHELAQPRSIDEAILTTLSGGPLSSNELALVLQRRGTTVKAAARLLEADGKITRIGAKWSLVEARHEN